MSIIRFIFTKIFNFFEIRFGLPEIMDLQGNLSVSKINFKPENTGPSLQPQRCQTAVACALH